MSSVLGSLIPVTPVQEERDKAAFAQQEKRQEIFSELRETHFKGVYSDAEWDEAIEVVERLAATLPVVFGDPKKMGEATWTQFYHNCQHIARAVFECLGNRRIPREPTDAMLAAGAAKLAIRDPARHTQEDMAAMCWRKMYDAAILDQEKVQHTR